MQSCSRTSQPVSEEQITSLTRAFNPSKRPVENRDGRRRQGRFAFTSEDQQRKDALTLRIATMGSWDIETG